MPATSPWYQGLVPATWGSQGPAAARVRLRVYWRGGRVRAGPRLEGFAVTLTFKPTHKNLCLRIKNLTRWSAEAILLLRCGDAERNSSPTFALCSVELQRAISSEEDDASSLPRGEFGADLPSSRGPFFLTLPIVSSSSLSHGEVPGRKHCRNEADEVLPPRLHVRFQYRRARFEVPDSDLAVVHACWSGVP
jgi:hypothetical protein